MTITSRIDAVTKIGAAHLGVQIPAPRSVKVEITATCNLRCSFCVKSIRKDDGEMDRALYSKIIRDMRQAGVEELGVFLIGESFICSWLPDAIREAKQVGYPYVFLTTNGVAATPDRVKACMEAGLDSLKFSINMASAEQFSEVAQVSGKLWRRAIDNFKAARCVRDVGGYQCGLYASSIAFDGEQGKRMEAVMAELAESADQTYQLPLYGMSGAAKASGMKPNPGNPGRVGAMRDPLPCWSCFTEAHVTKDGLLAACCFGMGIDGELVMGDLRETDFLTAWNSEKFKELRAAHLAKDVTGTPCERCMQ